MQQPGAVVDYAFFAVLLVVCTTVLCICADVAKGVSCVSAGMHWLLIWLWQGFVPQTVR